MGEGGGAEQRERGEKKRRSEKKGGRRNKSTTQRRNRLALSPHQLICYLLDTGKHAVNHITKK